MSLLKDITEPEMKRAKQSESEDRLSDLPDCLILHILSFVKCKYAVQTCVLSKRWKHLWKCLPTLLFDSAEFGSLKNFSNFVSRLLSLRDGSLALHTLYFQRHGCVEPRLMKRVIKYAISHNVQELAIGVKASHNLLHSISSSIFSCQTLTSLKIAVYSKYSYIDERMVFPKSLNLPALTSLYLVNIAFCSSDNDQVEPFSTLNRLNNLVIRNCTLRDEQILCICSTTLSSLTLCDTHSDKIVLSTPNLCSFAFNGVPFIIPGSILSSLEQVNIDAYHCSSNPHLILLNWLKELANVQSLTVTSNTLQMLFLIPDLLKIKLSSLGNLKSLKVKMRNFSPTIPDGILDFLLQNSLSSKVTIIEQ